ncbi:hypothetical protein Nepgr_016367 [Nepenthes gracilis]|uniref:Uncharacterized protein n=1 Tax=Nepenthes gracilis TaxID=150966 RepID=A0AAD3SQD2_NEPGR|nr:hypothetical protein Nepgr_016367 [Nepenthes gracilis]
MALDDVGSWCCTRILGHDASLVELCNLFCSGSVVLFGWCCCLCTVIVLMCNAGPLWYDGMVGANVDVFSWFCYSSARIDGNVLLELLECFLAGGVEPWDLRRCRMFLSFVWLAVGCCVSGSPPGAVLDSVTPGLLAIQTLGSESQESDDIGIQMRHSANSGYLDGPPLLGSVDRSQIGSAISQSSAECFAPMCNHLMDANGGWTADLVVMVRTVFGRLLERFWSGLLGVAGAAPILGAAPDDLWGCSMLLELECYWAELLFGSSCRVAVAGSL